MRNYRGLFVAIAVTGILAAALSCSDDDDNPVTPVIPAKVAFSVQPGNAVHGVAMTPAPAVAIQDASGATVTASSDTVTIALAANPGGSTLGGTLSKAAVNGVATFDDITLDQDGNGYTLTASSSGLTSATSAAFNVTPPLTPSKLAFVVEPSAVVNGEVIAPAPAVAIQDAAGTLITTATDSVTIAIANNPGGATLGGTLKTKAVSGIATFGDLTLNQDGAGYTLTASAAGLTSATSGGFDVLPTLPTSITVTTAGIAFRSVRNGTQNPAIDTLKVGGTVTWTNLNPNHVVRSTGSPSFPSQSTGSATYGPITFSSAGSYNYDCQTHGGSMFGRVVVMP